ncbi:MAG: hypothetical protein QOD30_24 [Actinomycetota bacterium]|jgi:hypothetical protein|nr:hypothetical protein [Actinomycetota bacterium]
MAFGQQSGPPATARQVDELLALVRQAGHTDFRDARGALGLTQRQAGGKFTREEADALIETLQQVAEQDGAVELVRSAGPTRQEKQDAAQAARLRGIRSEVLAGELQRRGWIVMEP